MRFVQHQSTETKMKNNSLASTWGQADRPAIRQGKRNEKKRNGERETKKKMWVHHVCNWECHGRLRHPKRFLNLNWTPWIEWGKNLFRNKRFSTPRRVYMCLLSLVQILSTSYCVQIYTASRISQRDFRVMHFVALQHKSKKDDKELYTYTKRLIE